MYDPLIEPYPLPEQPYPDSYWASNATPVVENSLEQDTEIDIAIIGAGYTGLSAAYHLALHHKAKVAIVEANKAGGQTHRKNCCF